MLLAGIVGPQVAPWLVEAPLLALQEKDGTFRPITVGEVI